MGERVLQEAKKIDSCLKDASPLGESTRRHFSILKTYGLTIEHVCQTAEGAICRETWTTKEGEKELSVHVLGDGRSFRMCLAPTVVNGRPPLATLMKLPRYNTTWESAASRRELKGAAQPQENHRQQPSMTRDASSGVRRSQSAAPRRQSVPRSAYERRSHSTEPNDGRSEELPIPEGGRMTSSSIHNVDANELVKMYDFAVSCRKIVPWLVKSVTRPPPR